MYRSELMDSEGKGSGNSWRVDTADHFMDVIDHIRTTPPAWDCTLSSQESHGSGYGGVTDEGKPLGIQEWAGTHKFEDALKLAHLGWDQGCKLMAESLDAANVILQTGRYKVEGMDVGGAYPFIPAAVSGDPICMVTNGLDQARTKPLFRIMVSGSVSHNVSIQTIIQRGAAILSWVDKLENMGYRCELLYIDSMSGHNPGKLTFAFPIKDAGQMLSIDRAAFMLAHPAMLRRIIFALYERHKDLQGGYSSGYGSPSDAIPEKLKVGHSIYFPCLHGSKADYATPEKALAAVERTILKALQNEDVEKDLKELTDD